MTATDMRSSRMDRGLSLRSVAKAMGVSAPYLSDIERGRRNLTPDMERRFLAAINGPAKAGRLACPSCQSPRLTPCEPTPQSGKSPAWRCISCNIKFIITNPSYLTK